MEEGFRVHMTVNINNNNIISEGPATINNNNNNTDGSTNNNTNNVIARSPEKNKRKFDELEDQNRKEDSVQASKVPTADARETTGVKLLTTELVGEAFKTNNDKIRSLLMKDEVTSIGVCGMGGVGKTTLLANINNQLLESAGVFSHVYWVTVSHDAKIEKLQDRIAKEIKFDLSEEDDEQKRAAKLYHELIKRQNFVIILDDLWEYFDVKEIGIPIGVNGCKMIFTTRLLRICRRMCACKDNIIELEPLSVKEAWTLFMKELGDYNTDLEFIAKEVARECAGLPLGLKTMARSMRGVDDMSEWRNALRELKEAEKRKDDMELKVFGALQCSYDRLEDLTTQECFLYCAFFPEDFKIEREELIKHLIVEGIIKGEKSWQAKHDKGHVILNKLENACLLESCRSRNNYRCVKMHDLIRDMAIQKLRERSSIMVEAGARLREIPNVEEWNDSLERVSLMCNDIREIPLGHSPRCPKLSTLLLTSSLNLRLGSNRNFRLIAGSFFEQLHGLKVLNLSGTGIVKLPESISELVSLVALLLKDCKQLTHIPSLAKLTQLLMLDLSWSGLKKVPEGMELLSNLSYLNLRGSKVKELTTGILPNLSHLQVLILNFHLSPFSISVKGMEVACLRKLETLECYFEGFSDFRECMEHLSLCTYGIRIGSLFELSPCLVFPQLKRRVYLGGCCISSEQDFKAFPEDIEELMMCECRLPGTTLFGDSSLSLRCLMKLKNICLWNCYGIKTLFSLSHPSSNILNGLETIMLDHLESFCAVISRLPPLQSVGLFSCLKHFQIWRCHGVKRLFPIALLSTLQNLEILEICYCDKMKEIQATEDDDEDGRRKGVQKSSNSRNPSIEFIRLPKLKKLELVSLPELQSIFSEVITCDSLQKIEIVGCPKLKRIPLSYPLSSLQRINVYPEEWWETVEWDELTDKNLLQPILKHLGRGRMKKRILV